MPSLYRKFRKYGYSSIDEKVSIPPEKEELSKQEQALLEKVWEVYGHRSGIELSMLTHEPGYAWDLTRRGNETPWNDAVIANPLIEDESRERQAKSTA